MKATSPRARAGAPPLDIFCDRLTVTSALAALRLRPSGGAVRLFVLDGIEATRSGRRLTWALRHTGLTVEDMSFHTGGVRGRDGESVCLAAYRAATDLSFQAAGDLLKEAPLLADLNERWGRNAVRLHLARLLWYPLHEYVVRILVAREMAEAGTTHCLLLRRPIRFEGACLATAAAATPLHFYAAGSGARLAMAARALAWVLPRAAWRRIMGRVYRWRGSEVPVPAPRPALLLVQEDDLSVDPSFRVQPHWLSREDERPEFDTYVIQGEAGRFERPNVEELGRYGVRLLDERTLGAAELQPSQRRFHGELRTAARGCLTAARASWGSPASAALLDVAILLARAAELVPACSTLQVRVFAAADSYLRDADAMQLIARPLGIRTVAFQYSNLTLSNPVMMTNADVMAVFSSLYHRVWSHEDIRPGEFLPVGYLFDRWFPKLRGRAWALRQQLARAGARFVICYFDESIQQDRYGLISPDDHRRDLLALLQLVIDSPDLGVIVKCQFERNAPARLYGDEPLLRKAVATGRYVELTHGRHRNNVLPAEAALASDLAIGHCVGATAGLEAALAGTRTLLLNPYGMRLLHDGLYQEADVLYDSMEAALEALRAFRAGDANRQGLGDWTSILPSFDPYRDGQAAVRFRRVLDVAAGVVDAVPPARLDGTAERPTVFIPARG